MDNLNPLGLFSRQHFDIIMQTTAKDNLLKKAQLWQLICASATDVLSFDQFKEIYYSIYKNDPLGIAWLPDEKTIRNANVSQLMQKLNLNSYQELHTWSVTHRHLYWEKAIETLQIQFDRNYSQILDISAGGAENPDWLPNGKLNIIKSCFQAKGNQTAIIASDEEQTIRKISYQELKLLCNQVSNGLVKQNLQAGDRIVLYLPLCIEAVAAYLGIIQAGMVAVLVADSFSPQELKKRIESSNAQAVVTFDAYRYGGKALKIYDKIKAAQAPASIIISNQTGSDLRAEDVLWKDFLGDVHFSPVSAEPETLISILFSSGTTSEPKAIPWTQLTPIKCAADAHFHQDVHSEDVLTWTTGMGWMMGPWTIFAALMNKATLALFNGSAASPAFGSFVEKAGISILGTIPSLVKVWRNTGLMEKYNWNIRVFSSTGEPSQVEDYLYLIWLAKFKAPIIEYCGGTEIGGGYITGTVVQPASPATFTTATLGLELYFRDEERGNMGTHQDGEVFIVPPSIGLSQMLLNRDHHAEYYEGTPQLNDDTPLRRHGDSYQLYADLIEDTTFYKSRGRADDSMNLGGIKVSAVEIEKIINQHPAVYESAAVAVSPKDGGPEALLIFYVPQHKQIEEDQLKKEWQVMLSQQLNPLFRIKEIIRKGSLPRTASNKLMRRTLRKEYMEKY
ncbi:AMP-binding protein [Catalinimonas niigatensis]|uniref:AMP-binding protein n=1 Tax=Catalinimonas niigatensis TaxID=1397264 RepID=UPI002666C74E|nr:AMP-binding protein [Catalinimonas niigatensis]WPP51573.1 AMP-binding protein [Catalinimonas niigatensis]